MDYVFKEIKDFPLSENFYKELKIRKNGNEYRSISIPSPKLKILQRMVLGFFYRTWIFSERRGVYGSRKGSCYVDHVLVHRKSRWIFQFDIKNAFPSVGINLLRRVLEKQIEKKFVEMIIGVTTYKKGLPQGAPTSPLLFYLVVLESGLFNDICLASIGRNVSCYVDDFIISSQEMIDIFLQKKILKIIRKYGLEVNERKTCLHDCRHGAIIITGVSVDGTGRIRLPQKTIRKWRGLILKAVYSKNLVLEKRIEGFISSLKPIYSKKIPLQISGPYKKLLSAKNN